MSSINDKLLELLKARIYWFMSAPNAFVATINDTQFVLSLKTGDIELRRHNSTLSELMYEYSNYFRANGSVTSAIAYLLDLSYVTEEELYKYGIGIYYSSESDILKIKNDPVWYSTYTNPSLTKMENELIQNYAKTLI